MYKSKSQHWQRSYSDIVWLNPFSDHGIASVEPWPTVVFTHALLRGDRQVTVEEYRSYRGIYLIKNHRNGCSKYTIVAGEVGQCNCPNGSIYMQSVVDSEDNIWSFIIV